MACLALIIATIRGLYLWNDDTCSWYSHSALTGYKTIIFIPLYSWSWFTTWRAGDLNIVTRTRGRIIWWHGDWHWNYYSQARFLCVHWSNKVRCNARVNVVSLPRWYLLPLGRRWQASVFCLKPDCWRVLGLFASLWRALGSPLLGNGTTLPCQHTPLNASNILTLEKISATVQLYETKLINLR